VYDRAGFDFVDHVRRTMRGDTMPTTARLAEEVEALAPGFKALLDRLGASYVDPAPSSP
jgi:hypothetical protein